MWREQAVAVEWSWHVISVVACCHSVKLCTHAARAFQLHRNVAVTRMWRSCWVQPSHKDHVIDVVRCKKEGMLLQLLSWRCAECVVHHKQNVCKEQHHIYAAWASNNRVIMACDLYCCLLPQCEALLTFLCFFLCSAFSFRLWQCTLLYFFNTFAPGLIQAVRKKTAGSHVPLRRNLSSPVTAKDLVKGSKALASLVLCTQKKNFFLFGRCGFFVSDVISGGFLGHLGQLHLALGPNP